MDKSRATIAYILLALIIIVVLSVFLIKAQKVDQVASVSVKQMANMYIDFDSGTLRKLEYGWQCNSSGCSARTRGGEEDHIGLNAWSLYGLTAIYNILPNDDSKRSMVRGQVLNRLNRLIDRFQNGTGHRPLATFFPNFRTIQESFPRDQEISKLLATLRIWSAAQLVFDADILKRLNPLKDAIYGMMIATNARNVAAVKAWVDSGEMLSDLTLSGIQVDPQKDARLKMLFRLTGVKVDEALMSEYKDQIIFHNISDVVNDAFSYLKTANSTFLAEPKHKRSLDSVGFWNNSCWTALADYEAENIGYPAVGDLGIEQVLENLTSEAYAKSHNNNLFDFSPCVELVDLSCRNKGKFCEYQRKIITDLIVPRIAPQKDGAPGGFYNFIHNSDTNAISYSTSSQVIYAVSQGAARDMLF